MPLSPQCAHFVTEFNALVEVAVVIIFSVASFPVFKEDIILSMKDTVNINEIKSVNGLDCFLKMMPLENECLYTPAAFFKEDISYVDNEEQAEACTGGLLICICPVSVHVIENKTQ